MCKINKTLSKREEHSLNSEMVTERHIFEVLNRCFHRIPKDPLATIV